MKLKKEIRQPRIIEEKIFQMGPAGSIQVHSDINVSFLEILDSTSKVLVHVRMLMTE